MKYTHFIMDDFLTYIINILKKIRKKLLFRKQRKCKHRKFHFVGLEDYWEERMCCPFAIGKGITYTESYKHGKMIFKCDECEAKGVKKITGV